MVCMLGAALAVRVQMNQVEVEDAGSSRLVLALSSCVAQVSSLCECLGLVPLGMCPWTELERRTIL